MTIIRGLGNRSSFFVLRFFLTASMSIFVILTITIMILKFNDGTEFDTSGGLRAEERPDGWYVLGQGMLIPVSGPVEAEKVIAIHIQKKGVRP